MQVATKSLLALALVALLTPAAQAVVTVYTSEADFIAAAQALGGVLDLEGFASDGSWGGVRSVSSFKTASSVLSQGVTWTANFATGQITTAAGAKTGGVWGFLAYPHGSYGTGAGCGQPGACGDGFIGSTSGGFYAIGGWIKTNTPPARIGLSLDGTPVTFDNASLLNANFAFFGAISSTPFGRFEYREMGGATGDTKNIFADDFTFVRATLVPEPAAYNLMLLGLGLVGVAARRRRPADEL
jgi:hypothetical protein